MNLRHLGWRLGVAVLVLLMLSVMGLSGGVIVGLGFVVICGAMMAAMIFMMSGSTRERRRDDPHDRDAVR